MVIRLVVSFKIVAARGEGTLMICAAVVSSKGCRLEISASSPPA